MDNANRPPPTPETQAKGQHGTLATVRVAADNEQGFIVINESDYDEKKHELIEGAAEEAPQVKDLKDQTKAELTALAKSLGKTVPAKATKDQLLDLLK